MLDLEEEYWVQKAREQWIRASDLNTKFFHTTTVIKQRMRRIEQLKDSNGTWCDDLIKLEEWTMEFYQKLYMEELCQPCSRDNRDFPELNHSNRCWLNGRVLDDEILIALFHMGLDIVARLDGFIPKFFQ